jgi:hypothetical protein
LQHQIYGVASVLGRPYLIKQIHFSFGLAKCAVHKGLMFIKKT